MKEITTEKIIKTVAELCMSANYDLGEDVEAALQAGYEKETSPVGRGILEQILQNAKIARAESVPICQDTGYAVLFVEIGQDVQITGGGLRQAINEGVRQGYEKGYRLFSKKHKSYKQWWGKDYEKNMKALRRGGEKIIKS